MKKKGTKMPTPRQKATHNPIPTSLFLPRPQHTFSCVKMLCCYAYLTNKQHVKAKQRCRDGVMSGFVSWCPIYGESQGEKRCPMGRVRERKRCPMGRVRERKGVLWGESGREKVSYGESQGEKRCPMGRVRERKGVLWGESGREKVSYGKCQGEKRCPVGILFLSFS